MEEFNPDWFILREMNNANVTNENQTNRSRSKQSSSSSSIEVINEDELLSDVSQTSGLVEMNEQDEDVSEHVVLQEFTESREIAQQLITEDVTRPNKVTNREVTDSRNTNEVKINKRVHRATLTTKEMEALLKMLFLFFTILYAATTFIFITSKSEVTASLIELKEENRLLREELSNLVEKENSTTDLMFQKVAEKFKGLSCPISEEIAELKEQVRNIKTDIKILQDHRISGGSGKREARAPKCPLVNLLGKFTDMVSSLSKQIFPLGNKSQKKIPDETEVMKKLLKDLRFVMSNCYQLFGDKGPEVLRTLNDRVTEILLGAPLSDAELKAEKKIFQDLLAGLRNNTACMKIIKAKEMVSS